MTLRFNLLGYEIARIELELPASEPGKVTAVDKAAKGISNGFFKRMIR